ncbi:cytochrome P450 [Pisolithus croceorrhizus]|nr:cytochrome P450 [Pisolithus croceorrhizus]
MSGSINLNVGQESTSHTISWTLLELGQKPEIQSRLRSEIRQQESVIHTRGNVQFTASDLDNMLCLNAIIKASIHFVRVRISLLMMASQDCTLPLSWPSRMESGKLMHKVFIPKGTQIIASVATYNWFVLFTSSAWSTYLLCRSARRS